MTGHGKAIVWVARHMPWLLAAVLERGRYRSREEPTAGASAYAMSKAAVRAFASALRAEVRAAGVGVVLVSPGFVASEFRAVDNQGRHHAEARDPVPAWLVVPTPQAARVIVKAVARRRREVVVTGHGKAIVWVARHMPWLLAAVLERGRYRSREEPTAALGRADRGASS